MKRKILILILVTFLFQSLAAQTTEPETSVSSQTDVSKNSNENYLEKIQSLQDFDSLARVFQKDTPYPLAHAMFAIDRKENNKIYYINSLKYRFHKDFLIGNYFVLQGENLFEDIYINENRRFIVGTIAFQKTVDKYTFEFWEGDMVTADQIKLTNDIINKTFYTAVAFKPNSVRQEEVSNNLAIEKVTTAEILKNQEYLALNAAKSVGRVHIIDKLDDTVEIGYNEIIILNELPQSLPPVAGIIVTKPSSPLSHVNILAKGWGIPNAYIKDADKLYKEFDTWWVEFETTPTGPKMKLAGKEALDLWNKAEIEKGKFIKAPPSDLTVKKLATLHQLLQGDSIAYGAKAANLGEVANGKIPDVVVPKGFAIPFHFYREFMKSNKFDDEITDLLIDNDFVHNPKIRRQKLEDLRARITKAKFDPKLRAAILKFWQTELGSRGVFVRSSSNAEDMPNFSGAGLYSTVPNVKNANDLIEAVKKVWASLWNFDAFEARERNFIDHKKAYMGVCIQVGINMDNGGVMITRDPFNKDNADAVYIAVTRGHNIQVVDNRKVPEQILFSPKSDSVQILTRSNQDTVVSFDVKGGLKETPISTDRRILTDAKARDLVKSALEIKKLFGGEKDQDIEWAYMNGQIYILQSRPYIGN